MLAYIFLFLYSVKDEIILAASHVVERIDYFEMKFSICYNREKKKILQNFVIFSNKK